MATILDELIIAQPIPNGYSWTLASRLGTMIQEMEALYGPRDMSYTILGVEMKGNGPGNWFPGNCKHVVIQLGLNALNDPVEACFQLAQECVHLLTPTGKAEASVFEEGLTVHFAQKFIRKHFNRPYHTDNPKYVTALGLASIALNLNPNCVKSLRSIVPVISHASPSQLQQACRGLFEDVAMILAKDFEKWDGTTPPSTHQNSPA